jgi:hypothetical protein
MNHENWSEAESWTIVTSNNSLERTVIHRGRTVRAFTVGARAGAQRRYRAAAQLKR